MSVRAIAVSQISAPGVFEIDQPPENPMEPAIALQTAKPAKDQRLTSREVHVKNIIKKLDAHDRTHAVTLGLRRGIIHL